jgi:hypothetical protein
MRHFLKFPLAPLMLSSGVPLCSATRPLIPHAGSPVRSAA